MRYSPTGGQTGSPPGMTNTGGSPQKLPSSFYGPGVPPGGQYQGAGDSQGGGFSQFQAPYQQPQQNYAAPAPQVSPTAGNSMNNNPSLAESQQLLPDVYRQPFLSGLEAAGATGSYASQALPGAGNFQAGLYSPTLNPMEQQFMQSSGYLGSLGLEQALNEVGQEYALDPYNMAKNKSYYDAANQFAAQMMQTGSKLGLDRMSLATQNLPNVFEFPNKAAGYGQQSAAGLYNAYEQSRLGDLKYPFQFWSSYPIQGSDYIQPPAPSGGK